MTSDREGEADCGSDATVSCAPDLSCRSTSRCSDEWYLGLGAVLGAGGGADSETAVGAMDRENGMML